MKDAWAQYAMRALQAIEPDIQAHKGAFRLLVPWFQQNEVSAQRRVQGDTAMCCSFDEVLEKLLSMNMTEFCLNTKQKHVKKSILSGGPFNAEPLCFDVG